MFLLLQARDNKEYISTGSQGRDASVIVSGEVLMPHEHKCWLCSYTIIYKLPGTDPEGRGDDRSERDEGPIPESALK